MRFFRLLRLLLILFVIALVLYMPVAGRLLVADDPQKSDAILVLEGENDKRVQRGLEALRQGLAPRLLLDVQSDQRFYGLSKVEIGQRFIATLPPADASRTAVCPVRALSTKTEAHAAETCLRQMGARTVLLVSSDYHTRRALTIFRHELPQFQFSASAAVDPAEFGTLWWRNRQWAKNFFSETIKFAWFEVVDRWRS